MKILITNAFGPQNRGDHELLQSLISLIKTHKMESDSIEVFTTYPEESRTAFPADISFARSPFFRPKKLKDTLALIWDVFFWVAASYLPFFRNFLTSNRHHNYDAIKSADLIIMCPGGYLYSNGLSFYTNLINALPFRNARGYKIAAPMSIGPFSKSVDKFLAKRLLTSLHTIHTRESYSTRVVELMGLVPTQTPDLAWWASAAPKEQAEDLSWAGHYVGTVIDWSYPFSSQPQTLRARYEDQLIEACKLLSSAANGRPVILYNQVGAGDGLSADEKLIKRIVDRWPESIAFDPTAVTPEILRKRLRHCSGLIASRFHSALFAMQAKTPFIAISYQPKAEFILKDLGLNDLYRSIENFSGREISKALLALNASKPAFQERLAECQSDARKRIQSNFDDELSRVIGSCRDL